MAGIDDIGGQVLPGQENVCYNNGTFQHRNGMFYHYVLGKLASSAAAIEPHKHGNSCVRSSATTAGKRAYSWKNIWQTTHWYAV